MYHRIRGRRTQRSEGWSLPRRPPVVIHGLPPRRRQHAARWLLQQSIARRRHAEALLQFRGALGERHGRCRTAEESKPAAGATAESVCDCEARGRAGAYSHSGSCLEGDRGYDAPTVGRAAGAAATLDCGDQLRGGGDCYAAGRQVMQHHGIQRRFLCRCRQIRHLQPLGIPAVVARCCGLAGHRQSLVTARRGVCRLRARVETMPCCQLHVRKVLRTQLPHAHARVTAPRSGTRAQRPRSGRCRPRRARRAARPRGAARARTCLGGARR